MAGRDKRRLVDYRTIKQELLRSGSHFNDPDFPPDASSLYIHDQISSRVGHVVWKRPKDLCSNPRFVVRGACRHDLGQGRLGNCWFIAGAATLATGHKKLLERVVPLDQEFDQTYAGIFHFHFWWNGEWEEVVVDDYLPTNGRQLIYCQNREEPNEFWPALLEKAYAKLRGCYQKLDGGKLQDAMVDLTGGISEVIDLRDKGSLPPNLYDLLLNSYSMTSLLGCCIFVKNSLCRGQWEHGGGVQVRK